MVDLFNENTLFVFFFAMVAIYNYSALKEYQRMAIIYISVYALAALDIISIKLGLLFLIVALFCFFEIFTTDEMKFKILVNPIYKILDFMYIAIFQYSFLGICLALVMLKVKLPEALNTQNFIFRVLSWLFMVWTLTAILQQKYVIHTFGEMYKVFSQFPINKVLFNKKLDDAGNILVSIEDKRYFQRQAYSFFSIKYIFALLKDKISSQHGSPKIIILFESGRHFKTYLLYIYFHTVNTFLGDATFSKFLNAFDMKYRSKNDKDIYDCSNEGIFIACMGLSKRADYINQDNVEYYLQSIDNVDLNADIICDMVEKMMDKPYDGNYLK